MKAQTSPQHDAPHRFEQLMPSDIAAAPLLELASDLASAVNALGAVAGRGVQHDLQALLRNALFQDLSPTDLRLADGSARVPGQLRLCGLAVGRHEAPAWQALPAFLARWQAVYGGTRRGEAERLHARVAPCPAVGTTAPR